ncbi:Nucleolar protein 14 [Thelohanellus kitauei]|uniref:Nucleolar protein 14 n=1 Tax=Thelohanellus kitauei TaxID=669202 RepID=A0A0C2N1V3_THEKT|nr:Nucleolar protein 14 [Thelohanellus kitauei]
MRNDAVFLLNLFKIILAFIDIWKDLCHIKKVITLITPIIRISDISDCEEFSHISKKIHEMIQTGSKKRFDNNFLIKKVKTIHQYDPIIKEIKPQSDKSNKITLLKKIKKREHKGAVRELRKDSEYCAARQLRETIKNDEERMKKVKQLYKDISMEKCN